MKKYSNAIFVVFLIIFAAGLWLFNSNITRVPLLSDDNFYFVKAKVVEHFGQCACLAYER